MSDHPDSPKPVPSSCDPITMETVTMVVTSPKTKITTLKLPTTAGTEMGNKLESKDRWTGDACTESLASLSTPSENSALKNPTLKNPTFLDVTSENPTLENPTSLDVPSEKPTLENPTSLDVPSEKPTLENPTSLDVTSENPTLENPTFLDVPSEKPTIDKLANLDASPENPSPSILGFTDPHCEKPSLDSPVIDGPAFENDAFDRLIFQETPYEKLDLDNIDFDNPVDVDEYAFSCERWNVFPPLDDDMLELYTYLYDNDLVTATLTGPVESNIELAKRLEQIELMNIFEPKDNEDVRKNLVRGMLDTSYLETALTSLPPAHVITFTQLIKLHRYDLAEVLVDTMLETSQCLEERQAWADMLKGIVKQLTNKNYGSFENVRIRKDPLFHSLMTKLSTVDIIKEASKEPTQRETIEKAFETDWEQLFVLYEEKKELLTKAELHLVSLVAAWKGKWDIFVDCAKRGADIIIAQDDVAEDVHTTSCSFKKLHIDSNIDDDMVSDDMNILPDLEVNILDDSIGRSPLHEALKTGGFELSEVEGMFPDDLVNTVDKRGFTLLHLAVQDWDKNVGLSNIRFLMHHGADPGVKDSNGMSVIQALVDKREGQCYVHMLIEVVTAAEAIPPHCWRPVNGTSALNILVSRGMHQHILPFIEKGANKWHLCFKLTLIDTVVMQEKLPYSARRDTLAVLLAPPISLGPFHASVVEKRPLDEDNRVYQTMINLGSNYVFPLVRLFFPVISTQRLRKANLALAQLLLEGEAVCKEEMMALASYMAHLESEGLTEVVEYFHDKIELVQDTETHQRA